MGGFRLVEPVERNSASLGATTGNGPAPLSGNKPEGRESILTLETLRELVKDPEFDIRITEDEIADRSKGDALSKALFILQLTWFIAQCIARHVQGLSLTQLELTTLAMASLNGITFILWWDKPLGVQTVVRVYLERKLTDTERNVVGVGNSFVGGSPSFDEQLQRDESFRSGLDATHALTIPKHGYPKYLHALLLLALASVFGGIHCAGWDFPFPTYPEQMLWHAVSLVVTTIPVGLFTIAFIVGITFLIAKSLGTLDSRSNVRHIMASSYFSIVALIYASARLILLGQAIALLWHQPPNASIAVDWT